MERKSQWNLVPVGVLGTKCRQTSLTGLHALWTWLCVSRAGGYLGPLCVQECTGWKRSWLTTGCSFVGGQGTRTERKMKGTDSLKAMAATAVS